MCATALLLAAVVAGAATAAGPDDGPFDLRGPGPKKGQITVSKQVFVIKDADVTLAVGGVPVKLKQTMTITSEEEEKAVAVEGRQVTRSQTKVIKDEMKAVTALDGGQEEESDEPGALAGQVILSDRVGDAKWKHRLVEATPTDEQRKELDKRLGPECDDDLYPPAPVRPGHTWDVDAAKLRRHFGNEFKEMTGTVKQKFVRVEEVNGDRCAVIESTGPVKGKMKDDDGDLDFEMDLTATTWRSLRLGVDVREKLSGTIKLAGEQNVDGARAKITLKGRMSGDATVTVR